MPSHPDIFEASVAVAAALNCRAQTANLGLYPLSEGYVLIAADRESAAMPNRLRVALRHGRTTVITNAGGSPVRLNWPKRTEMVQVVVVITESGPPDAYVHLPATLPAHSTSFVLMRSFVDRARLRAAAVAGQSSRGGTDDDLDVTLLGVGPGGVAPMQVRAKWLESADHIILFDRIEPTVLAGCSRGAAVHVVPYVYVDFEQSIDYIEVILEDLRSRGRSKVTIAVEGNPEIFDLAPRVARHTSKLLVIPAVPIALRGLARLEERLGRRLIGPSYAMTSGMPRRHHARRGGLSRELADYLSVDLGCLLLEMYAGDHELVAQVVAQAGDTRTIAVLSDLFARTERIDVFESSHGVLEPSPQTPTAKGGLTTFVISERRPRSDLPNDAVP
jgi:siroheme synthase